MLGERTSRIVFGTAVTCPTYRHHPSQVAQVFASLGVLYPGRIYLGTGTGEAVNELASTGSWEPYQKRADRWVEAIEVIRQLWKGDWIQHKGTYYQLPVAKLYDVPAQPLPIYMAASGPNSARLVGQLGDGWITGASDLMQKPKLMQAFREGAQAAGRDPDSLPIRAETYVVVGGEEDARAAASRWHFTPKAWTKDFLWEPDPREMQRKAEAQIPLEEVYKSWPVSEDPAVHVAAIQKVLEADASHIYIHSGQSDQRKVIDFYGNQVLPMLRNAR
ncbi:MAG: LLM class flavin-dependent oxidoreductase [Thermomicrobiales bacterium]